MDKFVWADKINNVDAIVAEDINMVGKAVAENRNYIIDAEKKYAKKNDIPDISGKENTINKDQPNGYAGLNAEGKLKDTQIPDTVAKKTDIPAPIDVSGKEDKSNKNIAGGYAGLDSSEKIQEIQIPDTIARKTDIPLPVDITGKEDKSNKNVANGYAGLNSDGKIELGQMPSDTVTFNSKPELGGTLVKTSISKNGVQETSLYPENVVRVNASSITKGKIVVGAEDAEPGNPTVASADYGIDELEKTENKGIAGGYASLDDEGKVPQSQLPDNIGDNNLSIMVSSDIEYEVVEGIKVSWASKNFVEDTECFTVFIKIPEKKFAAIYATARNATDIYDDATKNSGVVICDSEKNIIANNDGKYDKGHNTTANGLTVFGANYINNYENPVYCALSYTNGTAFEVGLFGADAVTESYLPISETDLPDDFIVDGDNLVTGLYNVRWSTNGYWQYYAIPNTNFFEVENGDIFYLNGKFIYLHYFDENYIYLGASNVLSSGVTSVEMENVKYAYAHSTTAGNINEEFWISRVDLSRKKHKPNRIVNPKYIDLDNIDRVQLNSWYNGKVVSFLGDSITQGGHGEEMTYCGYVDKYFGFSSWKNCGIGGTFVSGNNTNAFWSDKRINSIDINSDIVFIAGGTNDANNNISLGENDISNHDVTTFYGAYNVLISKLLYKFYKLDSGYYASIDYSGVTQVEEVKPVKIFLVTPPYMLANETQYNKTPAFAEAVIEIGKLTGYPVCDTRANSGVNIMLAEYYKTLNNDGTGDYVHLSTEAHKNWASVIIGKMLEVEPIE